MYLKKKIRIYLRNALYGLMCSGAEQLKFKANLIWFLDLVVKIILLYYCSNEKKINLNLLYSNSMFDSALFNLSLIELFHISIEIQLSFSIKTIFR